MSDFLSRLVDRSRGLAVALVPRLPSRFEPQRAAPPFRIEPREETSPVEPVFRDDPPVLSRAPTSDTPPPLGPADIPALTVAAGRPVAPPPFRAEGEADAEPGEAPTDVRVTRAARPVVSEAPEEASWMRHEPRRHEGAALPPRDQVGGPDAPPAERAPWRPEDADRQRRIPARAPALPEGGAEHRRTAAVPEAAHRGALVPAPPAASVPAGGVQVSPRGQAAWSASRRQPPGEEATRTEAVVNVTIGRIEVRAVPGDERQRERAAAGPKPLALDEYLRRRGAAR